MVEKEAELKVHEPRHKEHMHGVKRVCAGWEHVGSELHVVEEAVHVEIQAKDLLSCPQGLLRGGGCHC